MKIILAIKTQMRGRNFWLLCFIALLSIATILGLLNINATVQELEQAELNYNTQLVKQLGQSNDIAAIQIEFKTQIQAWNNLLLRGHDPESYKKYWRQFELSEAKVRAELESLHHEFLTLETQHEEDEDTQFNESASLTEKQVELRNLHKRSLADLRLSNKVEVLLEDHALTGKVYREFLGRHSLAESASNAFVIAQNVRGIDRWLGEQLLLLHDESVIHQKALTAQANAKQQRNIHELRLYIQRNVGGVILILLINLLLLIDRLRSTAKALSDVTRKSEAAMYALAYSDSLTGLPNRHLFNDKLDRAIALSRNTGHYSGLIFLDLDNFKTLNDTKGHAQGDLLLIEVAQRLRASVRATDTVARLGGDEFVVILDALRGDLETAAEQAGIIAEKICIALNQPYHLKAHTHYGGASIGVALFNRGETSSEELLKRADTAMYQAKRAGRNTVRFYDQDTQNALEARNDLEHSLHSALADDQMELYYQIQVDQNKAPIGAEALLRWHHPELGMLYPQQFITLAEESDLIITLGNWVLSTACAQIKQWESSPLTRDLVLSINVSAAQLRKSRHVTKDSQTHPGTSKFRKPNFIEQVQKALTASGINPSRLKLEITESMALHDIEYTIELLQQLKVLGVSLSMDDFGTGHSSLMHLKRMPIDQIKIDQSFVKEIVTDNYDQAIVRSMIAMAASMGINILAEGVETQAQEDALASQGCLSFQGHLFGKPLPLREFESSLELQAG
jgi:diguanylate cyclase (GGDEF)-like protein